MASLNKVMLIGNLGKAAEVRYTPAGKAVATITLATTEKWTDGKGQKQEKTEWHRVEFWERLAEVIGEYTKKGSAIYVEGSLTTDKYQDKDGKDTYSTKIKAQSVQLLDRRGAPTHREEDGDQEGGYQGGGDDDQGHGGYSDAPAPRAQAPAPAPAANAPAPRRTFQPRGRATAGSAT